MSEEKGSAEKELEEHCERILMRELRRWDGRLRDPTGRLAGRLRLGVDDLRNPKPGLFIEWFEGLPEKETLILPNGEPEEILKPESLNWYSDEPLPLDESCVETSLIEGLDLQGEGLKFIFEENDLYLLQFSGDLAKWVSVSNFTYGQPHHFITHETHEPSVSSFLEQHSSGSSELSSKRIDDGVFKEWFVSSSSFRLDSRPDGDIPSSLKPYLRTGKSFRLRLLGGLQIGSTRGVYLKGGEPVVTLSDLVDIKSSISIKNVENGEIRTLATDAASNEVELWKEHLAVGKYEISHGTTYANFQIVEGIKSSVSEKAATQGLESSVGVVSGTVANPKAEDTSEHPAVPYTVKFSPNESIFLGTKPSDFHKELVNPRWWAYKLGGLDWASIDVWLRFEPIWQITKTRQGMQISTLVGDLKQAETPDTTHQDNEWCNAIRESHLSEEESPQVVSLWDTYLTATRS